MKNKKIFSVFLSFLLFLVNIFSHPCIYAEATESDSKVISEFSSGYGNIDLKLQKDFSFIQSGSKLFNYDLALTCIALSDRAYMGDEAKNLLLNLGYDTASVNNGSADIYHPVATMGYKRLTNSYGEVQNIFTVVIRGSLELEDFITDALEGLFTSFSVATANILCDMGQFMDTIARNTGASFYEEDNYFVFTGHSLGGAIANELSATQGIIDLCKKDKSHIYTYTYESPLTTNDSLFRKAVDLSNAYNFKNIADVVTKVPMSPFATTYGTDVNFSFADLNADIGIQLFGDNKFNDIYPPHDRGLCLIYLLQNGIGANWWSSINEVVVIKNTSSDEMISDELTFHFTVKTYEGDNELKEQVFVTAENAKGQTIWIYQSERYNICQPNPESYAKYLGVIGRYMFIVARGYLTCLDKTNGKVIWINNTFLYTTPCWCTDNSAIYIASGSIASGEAHAVKIDYNGDTQWEKDYNYRMDPIDIRFTGRNRLTISLSGMWDLSTGYIEIDTRDGAVTEESIIPGAYYNY